MWTIKSGKNNVGTNDHKRDYNEWLEFCSQVQNSAAVAFNDTEETQQLRIKRALTDYNFC